MDTILSSSTKLLVFKIASLIFLLNIGIHSQEVDFCEMDDQDIITETQCNFGNLTLQTISDQEKKSIERAIHDLRNTIAEGYMNLNVLGHRNYILPQASSMTVMKWSNTLEAAARKTIMDCNFTNDVIKFGQFKALKVFPHIGNQTIAYLKTALFLNFLTDAQSFNASSLTDYKSSASTRYFTLLAHHGILFVGCAVVKHSSINLMSECYFAPWEDVEHKVLYKPGVPSCSDCPFSDPEYNKCNKVYKSLCSRPPWGICDHQTQDKSYMEGYEKYKQTTPTTLTTTAPTTPSSASTTRTSTTTTSTNPSLTSTTRTSTTTTSTTPTSTPTTRTSTTTTSTTPTSTPTTRTSTTTTELTTTKSRSPEYVPSCYFPIISFLGFLVQCL